MFLVFISIGLGTLLYVGVIALLEVWRTRFTEWAGTFEVAQKIIEEKICNLPVEFKEDEQWARESREFARSVAELLHTMTNGGNGHRPVAAPAAVVVGEDGGNTEAEQAPAAGPTVVPLPDNNNPVLNHVRDRLLLLERLVGAHYPLPLAAEDLPELDMQRWPVNLSWLLCWGIPTLLTVLAGAVATATGLAELGTLIPWLGGALVGYLLLSALIWWRREAMLDSLTTIRSHVRCLEHYAVVPFQDRVQLDMALGLIESISVYSEDLNEAIAGHRTAVDAIPQNLSEEVSKQVRTGLEPLQAEIETLSSKISATYENMAGALTETAGRFVALIERINDFDEYQKWAEYLGNTTESVSALAGTLTRYQGQTEGFYDDLRTLAAELQKSQSQIAENHRELHTTYLEITQSQTLAEAEILDVVREQLRKIHEEQQNFTNLLDKLSVQVNTSQDLYRTLAQKLPEIMTGLTVATQDLHSTIETIHAMPTYFKNALDDFKDGLEELRKTSREYIGDLEGQVSVLSDQHTTYVEQLDERNNAFEKARHELLAGLSQEVERYVKQLRQQTEGYQDIVESMHDFAERVSQPEHWAIKALHFTLLVGILISLIILITQG